MDLSTYAGLKDGIARTLRRTDLTADIPAWIGIAEAQMNDRLRTRQMLTRATATVGAEYVATPGDFAGAETIDFGSNNILRASDPAYVADLALRPPPGGPPCAFAVVGDSLRFWPKPGQSYTAELTYFRRLPALSDTNPTNWLLKRRPDAYLYGALTQSAPFLKADERLQTWVSLFATAVADLNKADRNEVYGASLQVRPSICPV